MADEPTSSLDSDRREAFVSLLLRESEKAGSSVLFVSHDASLAGLFKDRLDMSDLTPKPPEEILVKTKGRGVPAEGDNLESGPAPDAGSL
jgi:ABC-type lipoprotein export system ATPase subunit